MKESLFGPDIDKVSGVTEEMKRFFKDTADHFAARNKKGDLLPLDAFIDFNVLEIGGRIKIDINKGENKIPVEIEHIRGGLFSIKEDGFDPEFVEVDYREPSETDYPLTTDQQIAIQNARHNTMAITPMGSEDGFTPTGDYTNFIMWFEGVGIHVDPSPRSLLYLEKAGIDPDDIPYILLTHNHADHDSGLIRKLLMKKRVKLLASRPVYESFLIKAKALMGEGFAVENWLDWIELSDERTNEIILPSGEKAQIDIRYNMHPIPTIGFVISYKGKSFGYSGDTRYEPKLIKEWLKKGKISKEQADKLLYFFWDEHGKPKVDLLFHESGDPAIHTLIDDLCSVPEEIYERMYIVHVSPARLKNPEGIKQPVTEEKQKNFARLKQPGLFDTRVLIPADDEAEKIMLAKTLDNVNLLSHMSQEAKMALLNKSVVRTFNPGDPVIFEGNIGDTFYIILSGHAEVVTGGERVVDASGKEWLLGGNPKWTYYPKDSFGEVALMNDKPRTASVRAASSLKVLEIKKEDFLNMIYAPLKAEDNELLRAIKYCIEEWIQRYSESLIYNISDINLTQLARQVSLREYRKGEKIISQGEKANTAYIIFKGNVSVHRDGNNVANLSYADIFGEMALIESIKKGSADVKRNADCIAEDDVRVLEISKDLLAHILHLYPGLDRGLSYEFRRRQLPQAIQHPSPHKYMVKRPEKSRITAPREETERILERRRIKLDDLEKLTDEEKIILFLNDIFGDFEFHAPDEFSDEFYDSPLYRENLVRLIQHLKTVFTSFQVQRFYHKFIEVSIYDNKIKTKTVYRFVRNRKKNIYKWMKESEVDIITELPDAPVNAMLVNLESEKYQGVKGTPENVKTLQAYLEMYNPECNLSLIDCQWPENSIDFVIERIKVERPEIICLSSTFGCLKELEKLMQAIRKMPFKPLVVIGGLTATWANDYLLEKYPEVIYVQREGEEALSRLVKLVYENDIIDGKFEDDELLKDVANLIYLKDGRLHKNPVKKVDLAKAPHPSRSTQLTRMKNAGFLLNAEGFGRGCGYGGCAFCTRTHGRLRHLPVTRVKGDFEEYMQGGASFIVYADEDFLPDDPKELDEFIDRIEAAKEKYRNEYFIENGSDPSDVSFYIATRARCIWREDDPSGNEERVRMLKRLKKIGLVKIFLGVESGSQTQLKKTYTKEASLLEIKEAIRVIRGLGIQLVTGFITFDPVVTLGQLQENIQFVREMNLVKADPLTEPINPFKQFRAQVGAPLVSRYRGIGLISSDFNPDSLMHNVVYRSRPVNLIMHIGQNWDEMISELEYSLKGIVWHAEQSKEERERAELFINLFNWFRERGYLLLEDLTKVLLQDKDELDSKIDKFFDRLSGLGKEKILFELKRVMFPHADVYKFIENYIALKKYGEQQTIDFLKEVFKGRQHEGLEIEDDILKDMARDISFQVMTKEEVDGVKSKLNEIYRMALMERLNKMKIFRDSNWRAYYSLNPDLVERGIEFSDLLDDNINRHAEEISRLIEPKGMLSHEENPQFKIYHRVNLKEYFQYRHPDMADPLCVIYKLANIFIEQKQVTSLDKVFLCQDGSLVCEDLRGAKDKEIIDKIYQGLQQIYISSYDPFDEKSPAPATYQFKLSNRTNNINHLIGIIWRLHKDYTYFKRIDLEDGGFIEFTNRTIQPSFMAELILPKKTLGPLNLFLHESENMPAGFRWKIPSSVYKADDSGKPIITKQFLEYIVNIVKNLLSEGLSDEEYHRNVMVVNTIIDMMGRFYEERGVDWITAICDIVDDTVRPLTIYLPDNNEGRKIAKKAGNLPIVFLNALLYEKIWPGIMPHLEDIILLATPGILDDFPKMLELVKKGELRPDLVQLIYEVFHNRVPLDVYRRNSNVDEIIKYTTNSMRIMPRKTPVLLLDPFDPRVGKYISDRPLKFMSTVSDPEGEKDQITRKEKLRILLSPYTYKNWQKDGVSFLRPDTEMEWVLTYPTASHRTLFVLGKERGETLIGKVHSTIWAGPAMRRLKPDAVEHSYQVSERIKKPVDRDELPDSIRDKFAYFIEQGYTLIDRALYPEGIGVLYRSTTAYPEIAEGEKRFLMPTFSAHNNAINVPYNTSETPLTQLIDRNTKETGEDPVDYFIREILKPLYDIYFYYMFEQGFLLEPHGQNFFLEIDENGKLRRLVFKDWQSTMVDMKLRQELGLSRGQSIVKHLLGIEASEETSLSIVFDYYWGTYLMKQLLEVMVNRYHGDKDKVFYRQLLLERFKSVFEKDYNKYPAAQSEFSDVSIRHGKKPSEDRSNTVYFAAGGAPLLRKTNYERRIEQLIRNPMLRKGRVVIPIDKIADENAIIQRQEDLPEEMVIDFERVQVNNNAIVVYPKNYNPRKKYNLLVVLHGKGSHSARLADIPEKIGDEDAIVVIPKAPFNFGTGYTWFNEGEDELKMKTESIDSVAEIIRSFEREGKATGGTYILGISEGGYMAHLFGMRYPKMIKGIIAMNAPFREGYFTKPDLDKAVSQGYPDIFIIQYGRDRIVVPANSQRAEDFYKSKGLSPKVQYYSSGSHHRLSGEIGEDIGQWMKAKQGVQTVDVHKYSGDVSFLYKEAQAAAKMTEGLIPLLLVLLPEGNNEKSQILKERFNLVVSSLCYCLFQIELRMKDDSTKIDPDLIDTIKWMGKEAKFLLEELIEIRNNAPKGDMNLIINNISENQEILAGISGGENNEILLRIPVQVLEGIDKDSVVKFLGAWQKASNCFIEFYSIESGADIDKIYGEYGLHKKNLPPDFVKKRENTVTLFVPVSGELIPGDLQNRLGEIGLEPTKTILSPVGQKNDPIGLVRSTIMGFRLMYIARNKTDYDFVRETLRQYRTLFNIHDIDLTESDLINIAAGDINDLLKALKKLVKLLPTERYDSEEIKKVYKHAETILIAA